MAKTEKGQHTNPKDAIASKDLLTSNDRAMHASVARAALIYAGQNGRPIPELAAIITNWKKFDIIFDEITKK